MAEYIKLEDAIREIEQINPVDYGAMWDYEAHHWAGECLRDCKEAIDSIPAADVAPVVHGCFEPCFDENGNWRQGFAKCSNCDKEYYAQVINHFGYCPHCGAKMDGGADHEAG